ncbi:MAG: hypothetical protein ACRCS9_03060 [Hyphomicrobium sp.]
MAMNRPSPSAPPDSDDEYRAIESALLESTRGRWFLAEHGRRARRLDSALLEDAIGRLQTSLRQPPALLGQLQSELQSLRGYLGQMRTDLTAKPIGLASAANGERALAPQQAMLQTAESIHEIAWQLQANPFDPKGCEDIARNAGRLYAMSQAQAVDSTRTLDFATQIDTAASRVEALLETILHEMAIDRDAAAV